MFSEFLTRIKSAWRALWMPTRHESTADMLARAPEIDQAYYEDRERYAQAAALTGTQTAASPTGRTQPPRPTSWDAKITDSDRGFAGYMSEFDFARAEQRVLAFYVDGVPIDEFLASRDYRKPVLALLANRDSLTPANWLTDPELIAELDKPAKP